MAEEKRRCRRNPYSALEMKEYNIRFAKIKKGLAKHKIYKYVKEFKEYDARILHDFINSRIVSFDLLNVFEKRLIEIENFVAENQKVNK